MPIFKNKRNDAIEVIVNEKKITCPICDNGTFYKKRVQLNTAIMTFLNLDWANKSAHCYTCEDCRYIIWFED